jgi:bacteriocin-like protein
MKTMTEETMQQIDGGFSWADFACGASIAIAVGGVVMLSAATAGVAGALVFTAGYSALPASCAIALMS